MSDKELEKKVVSAELKEEESEKVTGGFIVTNIQSAPQGNKAGGDENLIYDSEEDGIHWIIGTGEHLEVE